MEFSRLSPADGTSLTSGALAAGWLSVAWCKNRVMTGGNDWPDMDMYL